MTLMQTSNLQPLLSLISKASLIQMDKKFLILKAVRISLQGWCVRMNERLMKDANHATNFNERQFITRWKQCPKICHYLTKLEGSSTWTITLRLDNNRCNTHLWQCRKLIRIIHVYLLVRWKKIQIMIMNFYNRLNKIL